MILNHKGEVIVANKSPIKRDSFRISTQQKDILKSLFTLPVQSSWLSDDEIEKILRDSTVTAAIGSRKAATLKKEILITCENKEIKDELEKSFSFDILESMLDIPYQGFGVFELNWEKKNSFWVPKIEERFYKDFTLDNRVLKFNSVGVSEDIPPYKAVYATYKSKPNKPYGQPVFQTLFWLIEFKNASLQFWVELLERFGTPWVIAKTQGDNNALADEIYNMLGGDGAVLDSEDELKIEVAQNKGDFKEIISYIDDQIREVILGGNLTGNVKGGSQAAATVHNDIREDLAQADENIVNKLIKDVIVAFKELNIIDIEIVGKLKDKDEPNNELATRDKLIFDMGYKPTKEYIQDTYNIKVEEVIPQKQNNPLANHKMSFSKTLAEDELDYQIQNIDTSNPLTFQKQIIEIIESSKSFEEVQDKLVSLLKNIDTNDLYEHLIKYMTNSHILAVAQIEEENPNG